MQNTILYFVVKVRRNLKSLQKMFKIFLANTDWDESSPDVFELKVSWNLPNLTKEQNEKNKDIKTSV